MDAMIATLEAEKAILSGDGDNLRMLLGAGADKNRQRSTLPIGFDELAFNPHDPSKQSLEKMKATLFSLQDDPENDLKKGKYARPGWKEGGGIINTPAFLQGATLQHLAVWANQPECLDILLSHEPKPDISLKNDEHGETAFDWACLYPDTALVKLFHKHCPDVIKEQGKHAAYFAAGSASLPILKYLERGGVDLSDPVLLHNASDYLFPLGSPNVAATQDTIRYLLEKHPENLNAVMEEESETIPGQPKRRRTALMRAVISGAEIAVRTLLSYPGIDLTVTDEYGSTARKICEDQLERAGMEKETYPIWKILYEKEREGAGKKHTEMLGEKRRGASRLLQ